MLFKRTFLFANSEQEPWLTSLYNEQQLYKLLRSCFILQGNLKIHPYEQSKAEVLNDFSKGCFLVKLT